jgi:preprotein translocase subunit SecE
MSRLQKKKPVGEKKKKKADSEKSVTAGQTGSSPGQAAAPPKAKPEKKSPAPAAKEAKTGHLHNALEFLREVKVELKKVTWPTRKQTTGTTIVVIIFVFVVAVFLGLFDYSLSKLVQVVLT